MLLWRFVVGRVLSVGLIILGAGAVCGQDYPNKPIRIVTGSVGGGADFAARIIAQGITGPLGQAVTVDNRAAIVAAETAAKAPPDGYTLLVSGSIIWLLPLLQKAPYDVADLSPISQIAREVSIVLVHPSVPVKSVKELIALAKAKPGELNYSSGSAGAAAHLGTELFKSMAGINVVWVPYKGSAPAITALIGGEVQMMIMDLGLVASHVKSGKLRALAVTSSEPSTLTPGLPTVAASGLPGYELESASGIWAPAKTPDAIIKRLNQEVVRLVNSPEVKERFFNAGGVEIVGSSPERFAATIKSESTRMAKIIKDVGIKP